MDWFWLAFISAVFSALSAVGEKKVLFSLDALSFAFLISLATLVFSIPFFSSIQYEGFLSAGILILGFKTILNAAAFLFVMYSIKNLEISEALPLLALTPGLVALFGILLIGDYLSFFEWIGIVMMIVGTYILEARPKSPGTKGFRKSVKNYLQPLTSLFRFSRYSYVIIALFLFALTSILDRILLTDYKLSPYAFMAYQQIFFAVIFSVVVLIRHRGFAKPFKEVTRKTVYMILLISVFTVVYRLTQIEAIQLAPVALVLSVKRLSVLMAIVFGGKLFKEKRLKRRAVAAIIIISGAAILMNM